MRDENGFKMHTQSESHVRQMLLIGEDPKKYINDYSNQFQRDFLLLLRTAHGEKQVQINHFYQEYIGNKEHVHMNATKWPSLTEFAKHLGREGICRVAEEEKGIMLAWIDNSPEALRRQDAVRKKERQDKGDEEREMALIREQVRKAKEEAAGKGGEEGEEGQGELRREQGEKIKLSFGTKLMPPAKVDSDKALSSSAETTGQFVAVESRPIDGAGESTAESGNAAQEPNATESAPAPGKISMKMGFSSKPKNVFAAAKKNALGGKKAPIIEQPKKMSEAERIMKEELERKRGRDAGGFGGFGGPSQKKQRF